MNIIEVKNLTYTYSNSKTKKALDNVTFDVPKGSWVSIVGHNGSGKSTLAKTLDGLMNFKQGEVKIDGEVLSEKTVWDIRKKIGMIFQNPDNQFVGATVEDDVAFGLENQQIETDKMHEIVADVLEKVHMSEFKKRQPDQLSGGQKQRVAIAGVLATKPDIIILDEATSMLDPEGRKEVLDLIEDVHKKDNLTIVSITHDVNEAMLSDNVIVLDDGQKIQEGSPQNIFGDNKLLAETGLKQPLEATVFDFLQENNIVVPSELKMDKKRLEEWICQSILKM